MFAIVLALTCLGVYVIAYAALSLESNTSAVKSAFAIGVALSMAAVARLLFGVDEYVSLATAIAISGAICMIPIKSLTVASEEVIKSAGRKYHRGLCHGVAAVSTLAFVIFRLPQVRRGETVRDITWMLLGCLFVWGLTLLGSGVISSARAELILLLGKSGDARSDNEDEGC